jgi:hypothetical protein
MCKCHSLEEHADRSQYVTPAVGDDVIRFDPHDEYEGRVGLLYHVDAYAGGLPRAHVVYGNGSEDCDALSLFQSPVHAASDPCWS